MKTLNNLLSTILSPSSCWNDIYTQLLKYNIPQKDSAGKLFEVFCKYYYKCEPSIRLEYKNVWLFSEIPHRVKEKLNLGKRDHGVDLVLEDQTGKFSVVQCKFRSNQNSGLSWSKDQITNLFAEGCNADYFIVFTNASKLDKHSLDKKSGQLKFVALGDLLNITSLTINDIKINVTGLTKLSAPIKQPREYQSKAILEVINGFKQHDRGQLILPCGAGKTLISLWIKEALKVKYTLVLVPSLALLRQIKYEWAANSKRYIPHICVCSEKDIDNGTDQEKIHTYEINGNVSTDVDVIKNFLNNHQEYIIYSTYQSLEVICDAIRGSKFQFDLAICDEAHKTTGSKLSKFGLIHSNSTILVKKRLYMTATPRILSDGLKNELNSEIISYLHDMSNADIFGTEFYRMSFKEAIDKKILVDYQIIAIGISNQELQEAIKKRKYTSDNETIDEIANNYALEKIMHKHRATHAITFHSSVKKAKSFQERHCEMYPEVSAYHVNGELTTNERNVLMKEFEHANKSIITNARCLTEGIDVPAIDVVYFCDPKNSKIDIVQATGRALRRADHKGKEFGYIVVPIYHQETEKIEDMIEASSFKNLMSVVRALYSQDERLVDEIREIKIGDGKKQQYTKHLSINYSCNLITIDGFHEELRKSLFDQITNKIRVPFRDFTLARIFVHTLQLKTQKEWLAYVRTARKPADIPTNPHREYADKGWISYNDWLNTNRVSNQNKIFLPFNDARSFVHALKLKGKNDWYSYVKSGEKPNNIPTSPHSTYKISWVSWGDWLGTDTIATYNIKYLSFEEARKFACSLNLKAHSDWKIYCKNANKPKNIPSAPNQVYKDKGWKSWPDWLGKNRVVTKNNKWCDFQEARKYVHSLNFNNKSEWDNFTRTENIPDDIPKAPQFSYKNKGWKSWPDWLGTKRIANQNKIFLPFKHAREFARTLGLKSASKWYEYAKSGVKPTDIPYSPNEVYEENWQGWPDWLGTKII